MKQREPFTLAHAGRMARVIQRIFLLVGTVMIVGGAVMAFEDPLALVLVGFGAAFVGAGFMARRAGRLVAEVEARPGGKGTMPLVVEDLRFNVPSGGRENRIKTTISVPEGTDRAGLADARLAWIRKRLGAREDWKANVIEDEAGQQGEIVPIIMLGIALVLPLFAGGAIFAGAGIFGLVLGLMAVMGLRLGWAGWQQLRRVRAFGTSRLHLERFPPALGARLTGRIETRIPRATILRDGVSLRLACEHVWQDKTNRGGTTRTRTTHSRKLWDGPATPASTHGSARSEGLEIRVDLPVPTSQPPATLSSLRSGVRWYLTAEAKLDGVDFRASFRLPMLDPDTAATLQGQAEQEAVIADEQVVPFRRRQRR